MNAMDSSSSSVSSMSTVSHGGAAAEAQRWEEPEHIKVFNEYKLYATCGIPRKWHAVWKKRCYFCSHHKDHKKGVYCIYWAACRSTCGRT